MNKPVFEYLMNIKRSHTKLNNVTYKHLQIQSYLVTKNINNKEKELLYNLRSKCHSSKNNLRKMNKNNLNCIFKCLQVEDQEHSLPNCRPILKNIENG